MFERVKEGSINWEIFKATSLDYFFPHELKKAKVILFMNLRQGYKVPPVRSMKHVRNEFWKFFLVSVVTRGLTSSKWFNRPYIVLLG